MATSKLQIEIGSKLTSGTSSTLKSLTVLFNSLSKSSLQAAKNLAGLEKVSAGKALKNTATATDAVSASMDKASKKTKELNDSQAALTKNSKKYLETINRIAPAVSGFITNNQVLATKSVHPFTLLAEASKKAKKEINEVAIQNKNLTKTLHRIAPAVMTNETAFVSSTKKITEGIAKASKRTVDFTTKTTKLTGASKKYLETINRIAPAVSSLGSKSSNSFKNVTKSIQGVASSAKKAVPYVNKLQQSLLTVLHKFQSFFAYMVSASLFTGFVTGIYKAVEAMFTYDQSLHDLKAITQATDVETERMGETIKKVASSTKFSTTEVAEGMRTLGQAGFTAGESIKGIKGIADLATGTLSNMADSVDLVSTAIRVFGLEANEAAMVSDVFANAINGSKLTMDKLRVSFNYIGPIAKLAGIEFKDLTSTMMVLANKGLRASTIGTGLRQVINKILRPTKAFTEAVAAAGFTMDDLNPKTNSMREVISKLGLVVQDADQAFEMFGLRGAAAVSALLEGGTLQFDKMRSLVDRTGIAAKMAGEQLKGLSLRLKQLGDKFSVFFAEMRDQGLAEPLGWIIDLGRKAMDVMIHFAKNGLAPVLKLLGLVGIGIVSLAFVRMIRETNAVSIACYKLGIALRFVHTSFLSAKVAVVGFFTSLGPIGWALMAISAALVVVVKSFRGYAERLKETILESEKFMAATDRLNDAILKAKVSLIGIREGTDEYKEKLKKLKDEIESTAKEFPELKEEADKVVATMDLLNGRFTDGQKALEDFEDALVGLRFDSATERIKAFDASLETSLFWQLITGKTKDFVKDLGKQIWEKSNIGGFFSLLNKSIGVFSKKYSSLTDMVSSKISTATTFADLEEASKKGGKALEDYNNLLYAGKEYIKDWAKQQGIALEKLSTDELEKLSKEIQTTLDLSDRMTVSMVKGAKEIAGSFKKQGISATIESWEKDFNGLGESIVGLKYQLTQQGDIFEPFKKSLDSVMGESDWSRLFDLESQKTGIAADLKELERLYDDHLIGHQEYAERKFNLGKQFNEFDRLLKIDEKNQMVQQYAELNTARNKELENLRIHSKRYSKEQQAMMRLEIDDKYLTKAVDLLYKLDEKRKAAADNFEKTEGNLKTKLASSWADYYSDMEGYAKELAEKRADLVEKSADKVLQSNINLNKKLRDLKAESLKDEVKTAFASKNIREDLSNAKRALSKGDTETAIAYAKNAQKALSSVESARAAEKYAGQIASIYKKSGKSIRDYQIDLNNDVRKVREQSFLADRLDNKAKKEMARDLSSARRELAKGDAEAALKYTKSAEASLSDVKDIRSVISYVNQIRELMNKSEAELLVEKQRNLTAEYSEKRNARKEDLDESLADNKELMEAAKRKFEAESNFLDQTLTMQKRNTAESIKGVNAQIRMYEAAKKTSKELSSMATGGMVKGYAEGGQVFSRPSDPYVTTGSGLRDDVPALLKKNEFVLQPSAVSKYGVDFLRRMNSGILNLKNFVVPKFAMGGLVGAAAGFSGGETFVNVNLNLPTAGRMIPMKMTQPNANEFITQLKIMDKQSS